jgi:ABC-type sugar transport system ATPase subunit
MAQNVICRISNITKTFPGVTALKNITIEIEKSKVHAVVGENGAGKSTLMNILSGVYHADEGTMEFEGIPVSFDQPRAANLAGIAMIHQELSLAQHMSAAENIFEGRMPKTKLGFIDRKKMYRNCESLLSRLGVTHINPKTLVKNLSVSEMQLLEIVKALSLEARMLIMDEPTSSLTTGEIDFLLKIVDKLRSEGVATLYISHKLEEIMYIADTITVLRDGQHVATKSKAEMDEKTMINLMVGRDFNKVVHRDYMTAYENRTPLLEVQNLSDMNGRVRNVSFSLYPGEVLGLTGLVGAGRTELLQSIFGAQKIKSGTILMNGEKVVIKHPRDAINLGMGLIPEGRKLQGLFLKMPVEDNMVIVYLRRLCNKLGLIKKGKTRDMVMEYVDKLSIKTPSVHQIVNNLSGGNQQKTIVARWLMNDPKILLMDEPTHGIDIGAKAEIYRIIDELSQSGVSVILLSSELPEVLSLCDRIMVMHHGEIRGILSHNEADQVKIMSFILEKAETASA